MIIAGNKLIHGGYPFIKETEQILDRARQEGFTLPKIHTQIAIDMHIRNLKTSGVWVLLDRYFKFDYNDTALTQFTTIDWKHPYGTLGSLSGGYTYTVDGFLFNGTNGYMNTHYNAAIHGVNYTMNNAGRYAGVYEPSTTTSNPLIAGNAGGTTNIMSNAALSNAQRINRAGTLSTTADLGGDGFKAIMRAGSTTIKVINKGLDQTFSSEVAANAVLSSEDVLAQRSGSVFSNIGISFYGVGADMSFALTQSFRTHENFFRKRIGLTEIM